MARHVLVALQRMRRAELEERLKRLGWRNTQVQSGRRHLIWAHPRGLFTIPIPQEDLILNAVADAILTQAGE